MALASMPARPKLVDFYCGAGSIAIYLSDLFSKIVGVEEVGEAVLDARKNFSRNDIDPPVLISDRVEKLQAGEGSFKNTDVVVVDPPRSGCHPKARRFITDLEAPVLVYVSCNPRNLLENIRDFERADYKVENIEIIDMFPQTAHMEAVVLMIRRAPST
ncbi:methyltransferase [bacterium]|nr:methyltransferase [bacterium]